MAQKGEDRQGEGQLCKGPEAEIAGVLGVLQNMGGDEEGARLRGAGRAPDFTLDVPQVLLESSGDLQPKPTKEPADTGPCDLGAVAAGLRSAPARALGSRRILTLQRALSSSQG